MQSVRGYSRIIVTLTETLDVLTVADVLTTSCHWSLNSTMRSPLSYLPCLKLALGNLASCLHHYMSSMQFYELLDQQAVAMKDHCRSSLACGLSPLRLCFRL